MGFKLCEWVLRSLSVSLGAGNTATSGKTPLRKVVTLVPHLRLSCSASKTNTERNRCGAAGRSDNFRAGEERSSEGRLILSLRCKSPTNNHWAFARAGSPPPQ